MISVDSSATVRSLQEFKIALKAKLEKAVRIFAYEITAEAIRNTPLGDANAFKSYYESRKQSTGLLDQEGYARGAWQASPTGTFRRQEFYTESSGKQALDIAEANLSTFKLGQTISIGNTAYYIGALENNYSIQTGGVGIIQPTRQQIQSIYAMSLTSLT